jgi:hypothetical protein
MDDHSLHVFLLRNGKIVDSTPEFQSFKRVMTNGWKEVQRVLKVVEKYATMLRVKYLNVVGAEIIKLIAKKRGKYIRVSEVVSCFQSYSEEK